jgi:hypothetical protein
MASPPDTLTLKRHRDLVGCTWFAWVRRALVVLLCVPLALGLANVFGQRPETQMVTTPAAKLKVYSPSSVRGGLYFESRFTITAIRELKNATLVLDPGWMEGMTLNSLEPSPIGEASRDGKLVFELGHVPAGEEHIFFLQFQVNPTNVGHRSQDVALYDEGELVAKIERAITVFP